MNPTNTPTNVTITRPAGLPGDKLKAILRGVGFTACQSCEILAGVMNWMGPELCKLPPNRERLVAELEAHLRDASVVQKAKAYLLSAIKGYAFQFDQWTDPAPAALDLAIRQAEIEQEAIAAVSGA